VKLDEYSIVIAPVLTEKSVNMARTQNKYTFKVAKQANKIQIAKAIEQIFDVAVEKVNTIKMRGKRRQHNYKAVGRTPDWKKAIVTLKEGQSIDLFEGF